MIGYFVRRFFLIIPTFVGITIMVFAITRFVPGGPIDRIISNARQMQAASSSAGSLSGGNSAGAGQPLSESQIEMLKKYYGFDKPLVVSYFSWLGKVLTGDLGHSTRY